MKLQELRNEVLLLPEQCESGKMCVLEGALDCNHKMKSANETKFHISVLNCVILKPDLYIPSLKTTANKSRCGVSQGLEERSRLRRACKNCTPPHMQLFYKKETKGY